MQQLRRIALEAHLEKRLVGPAFKEGLFQLPGRGDVAEWRAVHHQQSRQSTLAALRQGHDLSWWRLLPEAPKQGDKDGPPAACRYPATGLFDSRIHHIARHLPLGPRSPQGPPHKANRLNSSPPL